MLKNIPLGLIHIKLAKRGRFMLSENRKFVLIYRISSYSCRGNYSFLEVEVRQVFKGGNYSREETIVFLLFVKKRISIDIALFHAI